MSRWALIFNLSPICRAQGIAPPDQERLSVPRGGLSPWRRTPSTPPGGKVSVWEAREEPHPTTPACHASPGSLMPPCLPAVSEFPVVVQRTEAATRCQLKGPYLLVLGQDTIQLRETSSPQALYRWPYHFLRKFGSDKVRWTWLPAERALGGRQCASPPTLIPHLCHPCPGRVLLRGWPPL